jgi:hypothetical protein
MSTPVEYERLAVELRRLKEALGHLAREWEDEANDDEQWLAGPRVSVSEAQEYPATIQVRRACVRQVREALEVPDGAPAN